MKTIFHLMAQYEKTVIPLDQVRKDFFPHLTMDNLQRKVSSGEIPLAVVRIEESNKSAKGVHIEDLASYVDKRRTLATRELAALTS